MSYGYVPQYVTEEQDMSESDCPSDAQMMQVATDVTEIYRRKHQARSHTYCHIPGCFEHSRLAPCTCNLALDPRFCYYKGALPKEEGMIRSSTQLPRTCHDTKTASAPVKKYPVTARTPRYYRCVPPPLYKRPSTLCLPVTCQPDPGVHCRPRKQEVGHYRGQEGGFAVNSDYVVRSPAAKSRPVDSEGDVNSRLNDLENLLTKFDDDGELGEKTVEISGLNEISKILKPKVPASVKAKQEKIIKLRAVKGTEPPPVAQNISKLEVKEAEEPLDILLQRLNKDTNNKRVSEERHGDTNEIKTGAKPKSSFYYEQKPSSLDDNSAIELHKSKSYIVSLIDKALSRELGTVPGEKCTRKEFLSMNPKKAIDLVNRHTAPKCFTRTVSVDIGASSSAKRETSEEPLYLKQLKQLRWSHLRHIQREAKRLADLERFLDTFGEIDSSL